MKGEEEAEFVVMFKSSYQISPDDFEVYHPCVKVTENTTIGEVLAWFKTKAGNTEMEVLLKELTALQNKE